MQRAMSCDTIPRATNRVRDVPWRRSQSDERPGIVGHPVCQLRTDRLAGGALICSDCKHLQIDTLSEHVVFIHEEAVRG